MIKFLPLGNYVHAHILSDVLASDPLHIGSGQQMIQLNGPDKEE